MEAKQVLDALEHPPEERRFPRLLIVEDDPDVRDTLRMLLEAEYDVSTLSRGADDMLDTLDRRQPQLIIMDVNLPGRNGFELCSHIRESPRWRRLPVLFLTCRDDGPSYLKFLEVSGDAYLNKPFEAEELRETIERLLGPR